VSAIAIENLRKDYANHPVLRGVNLEMEQGDLICLIGRSGCGKSTLLRCLNGLEEFEAGTVKIGGHMLKAGNHREFHRTALQVRQSVGFVFQQFQLFPHLTLLDNVMLAPVVVKKLQRAEAHKRAVALLERVGLGAFGSRYPAQLSGGQQQRGAIARALALQPLVMLYDEPTSALDPELVDEVLEVMRALDRDDNITQIVVTHEMRFAREVADRIVFLDDGQIVEQGPPGVVFTQPKDERTRQFLKKFL
jgi:polar amino acid transport system ATP-binding protein